ncbi:cytochrome P450 [Ceratobasidium sp. AG-I]|nr:cytochrome P450 [Ceratobasidium sp. AG-I]
MDLFLAGILVGAALAIIFHKSRQPKSSVPLPPGPKHSFLFGSAFEVRKAEAYWLKFSEFNAQYGPIITIRMILRRFIIIDDPQIISELFEKRAAKYSDRHHNQMAKLMGWDSDVVFTQYGPTLKYYRTLLHRALNNRVALDYIPLQEQEVRKYLRRLAEEPNNFMDHIHLLAAGIAIRIAYGYRVDSYQDPFVQTAEGVMSAFSDALAPGRWPVEMFPPLRYLPDWFPFIKFKKQVAEWKKIDRAHRDRPFAYVEEQMAKGIAEVCFTSKLLQNEDGSPADDETKQRIKMVAASLYAAGSDTTVSVVQSFFLAMTLYPNVQAKAQAEIKEYFKEHSINSNSPRLITPAERPNLPYTSALVRELLRWHPVITMVAHRSSDVDDEIVIPGGNTYRIPARTLILANIWRMLHNPDLFPEPERFMPERYLRENLPQELETCAFGYGRRLCPGMHIAQQSMWISISNTLASFSIKKSGDEKGMEITPEERYTNGIISHPVPFVCQIVPIEGRESWLREESE